MDGIYKMLHALFPNPNGGPSLSTIFKSVLRVALEDTIAELRR